MAKFSRLLPKMSTMALSTLLAISTNVFAEPTEVTDILDRKVTVELPAKRVVLAFNYQDYMAVGGKHALDNVVVFLKPFGQTGHQQVGQNLAKQYRNSTN